MVRRAIGRVDRRPAAVLGAAAHGAGSAIAHVTATDRVRGGSRGRGRVGKVGAFRLVARGVRGGKHARALRAEQQQRRRAVHGAAAEQREVLAPLAHAVGRLCVDIDAHQVAVAGGGRAQHGKRLLFAEGRGGRDRVEIVVRTDGGGRGNIRCGHGGRRLRQIEDKRDNGAIAAHDLQSGLHICVVGSTMKSEGGNFRQVQVKHSKAQASANTAHG